MSPLIATALLAFFQDPGGIPLLSDCSDSPTVLATLAQDAVVEVRSGIAGGSGTCYSVLTSIGGKAANGYVLGSGLAAIAAYEARRLAPAPPSVPAPAAADAAAPPAPANPPAAATPAPAQPSGPPFPDFVAADTKGRKFSVRGIQAKVTLVVFWAPYNQNSERELLLVSRLSGSFKKQGVEAVGVILSGDRRRINDALDDFGTTMRNVPAGTEIAARYHVTPESLPRTIVLNERHEIVASGLHGRALEAAVRKLVEPK